MFSSLTPGMTSPIGTSTLLGPSETPLHARGTSSLEYQYVNGQRRDDVGSTPIMSVGQYGTSSRSPKSPRTARHDNKRLTHSIAAQNRKLDSKHHIHRGLHLSHGRHHVHHGHHLGHGYGHHLGHSFASTSL